MAIKQSPVRVTLPSSAAGTAASAAPPVLAPQLYWVGFEDYARCQRPFRRYTVQPPTHIPLAPFVAAVTSAKRRIWLLDRFFNGPEGMDALWVYLAQAAMTGVDVRIMTKQSAKILTWISDTGLSLPAGMQIEFGHERVHDRFALVDDDLWHCGYTVGGWAEDVSAVSHGWSAHVEDFSDLFQAAWRGDNFVR